MFWGVFEVVWGGLGWFGGVLGWFGVIRWNPKHPKTPQTTPKHPKTIFAIYITDKYGGGSASGGGGRGSLNMRGVGELF